MDFFKSILSDEPDPQSPPKSTSSPGAAAHDGAAAWSFGGLIKSLATQSESVLEIYRRDLKEFKSGLEKETAALRDAATRLPAEIDTVLKSTAEIISHSKDSLLLSSSNPDPPVSDPGSRPYSRFESLLRAIETDSSTYCSEPEDSEDFEKWKMGFVLGEEREDNETIKGVYKRVVPDLIDHQTFWFRYFYKVHKLRQQEKLRANLVKRAISVDLDEELSWDVDDEEDGDQGSVEIGKTAKNEVVAREIDENVEKDTILKRVDAGETPKKEEPEKSVKIEALVGESDEKGEKEMNLEKGVDNSEVAKSEEKVDSDLSIVSTQPTLPEEEDMGWDEIEEEVGSGDEKREKLSSGSPNRADLRKRLNAADDDEDLSWDIEDDDEPVPNHGAK